MTNIQIPFKPEKNDDGKKHELSFYQCPDTGFVEVAHIEDGHIKGEPYRHLSLSDLLVIIADALVCNFQTFQAFRVSLDAANNNDDETNVVPLHSE